MVVFPANEGMFCNPAFLTDETLIELIYSPMALPHSRQFPQIFRRVIRQNLGVQQYAD